tara:strand:- start:2258 stop:3523 length:1266 start_codon:yes stop_codon:yes gene_type:complete
MIDLLKKECEVKIGLKIKNLGDCKFLAHAILDTLNRELNYNTVRRLWGLAPYVKPRFATLDILAEFIGFNGYSHFTKTYQSSKELKTQDEFYKLLYKANSDELFSFVKKSKRNSEGFPNLIISLSRELIYAKEYDILNQFFRLNELQYESFSYSEAVYIGNSIGLLIRKKPFDHVELQKNTNFIRLIYLTFVDYSSIAGYYGAWTNIIAKHTELNDVAYFCKAVSQLRNFLVHKPVKDEFEDLTKYSNLHPILLGRILSVKILAHNYKTIETLLDPYFNEITEKNSAQLELSYELMVISISSNNIELMAYLTTQIKPDTQPVFYYQKHHINIYYLMSMFYSKTIDNKQDKKIFTKLFNPDLLRASYEEYITLLVLIFRYSETNSTKLRAIYKQRYLSLAAQLNYPYFSENLLVGFFKDMKN